VDPTALAACKDSATAAGGQDLTAVADAFKECVGGAFQDLLGDICQRITDRCDQAADPAALAEVCDRLADACSDPALSP
jgi:hypothetical protein